MYDMKDRNKVYSTLHETKSRERCEGQNNKWHTNLNF